MKRLFPIIIFAVIAGMIIYKRSPGVKAKIDNAVNKYGGWSEEARKGDPAGFIAHAIDKLKADKVAFKAQRAEYNKVRTEAEGNLAAAEAKVVKASEFAASAKGAYQATMTSDAWPVTFSGATYTKDQLVTQVGTLLHEKNAHEEAIITYKEILANIADQDKALLGRITQIDGEVIKLQASKQQAEMKKLTADADAMLAQVNDLLEGNSSTLSDMESNSPIRSIDDIDDIEEKAEEKKAATVANKEVIDFLESSDDN